MDKPKTPRRGTLAIVGGFLAAVAPFAATLTDGAITPADIRAIGDALSTPGGIVSASVIGAIVIGIYLVEKVTDVRLARVDAWKEKALADGTVSPSEIGAGVESAIGDAQDLFHDYRHDGEVHGPDAPESQPDYPQDVTH